MQVLEGDLQHHCDGQRRGEQRIRFPHDPKVSRLPHDRINPAVDVESTHTPMTEAAAGPTFGWSTTRRFEMRPLYKLMIAITVLAAPLLVMSGVWDNAHGFTGVLGGIGWFGFLLCVLALIVLIVYALGRGIYRRTSTA
jgi:hypothetical protein